MTTYQDSVASRSVPIRAITREITIDDCRERHVTPHVANKDKYSKLDRRTTTKPGYSISQRIRKRVEEIFGWAKTVGGFRRTRFRGTERTQLAAYIVGAAYNLTRMARLLPAPT